MDENNIKDNEQLNSENEHTYKTVEAKKVVLKDNYKFFPKNFFFRFNSRFHVILHGLFGLPFIWLITGLRVKGRKNIKKVKKQGAVLISNHINPGDAFFTGFVFMRRRVWFTMLQSNLGLPFGFGRYIRMLGAVPIPEKKNQTVNFRQELVRELENKKSVLIYPEAALIPFCDHVRPFMKGAFRLALLGDAPIVPLVYTFRKPTGLRRLWRRRKPCLTLNILEPYYPSKEGTHAEIINKAMDDLHKIMSDYFDSHTTFKYEPKNKKAE